MTVSKAFTKENDADEPDLDPPELEAASASTIKNYITPQGYQRLKAELAELWGRERPQLVQTVAWAAANGDRSENADYIYGKKRLREIDKRIRFLRKRLDLAEIVDEHALARALDRADQLRVLDLRAVRDAMTRSPGRRGLHPLQALLASLAPATTRTRSKPSSLSAPRATFQAPPSTAGSPSRGTRSKPTSTGPRTVSSPRPTAGRHMARARRSSAIAAAISCSCVPATEPFASPGGRSSTILAGSPRPCAGRSKGWRYADAGGKGDRRGGGDRPRR